MAQSALTSQFELHPPLLVKHVRAENLCSLVLLHRASLFSFPCIQTISCLPSPASSCLRESNVYPLQGYFCWSTMNSEAISLLPTLSPTLGTQLGSSLSQARFLTLTPMEEGCRRRTSLSRRVVDRGTSPSGEAGKPRSPILQVLSVLLSHS